MYLLWFTLAGIMAIIYWYLEWLIWKRIANKLILQKGSPTAHQRKFLAFAISGVVFLGISAAYFGLISFTKADFSIGCWLFPAIVFSLITGLGKNRSLG
jgi:hypothetical protein